MLDDDDLLARVLKQRDHGRLPGDIMFFNDEVGQKYKMSAMQAALGLAQLSAWPNWWTASGGFSLGIAMSLPTAIEISLNPDIPGLFNSYWMSTALLDPEAGVDKEYLVPHMRARGVDVRPFFYPLSMIPAFRDTPEAARARDRNVVAQRLSPYGINLPSALNLDRETVKLVAANCARPFAAAPAEPRRPRLRIQRPRIQRPRIQRPRI